MGRLDRVPPILPCPVAARSPSRNLTRDPQAGATRSRDSGRDARATGASRLGAKPEFLTLAPRCRTEPSA